MTEPTRNRHALITRPRQDATEIASAVMRRGVMPIISPVMTIRHRDVAVESDVDRCQALLFTSGNGVRAFCRLSDRRDRPVYVVGPATAALARNSGFSQVTGAEGSSGALGRLVTANLDPGDGPLFHGAGTAVAGDLAQCLDEAGFETVRRTLYEAHPVDRLPLEAEAALREDRLDYVLLFSARTARIFSDLVAEAGLEPALGRTVAVCLSRVVADALRAGSWRDIRVAGKPELDAVADTIDDALTAADPPLAENATGRAAAGGAAAPAEPGETAAAEMVLPDRAASAGSGDGAEASPDRPQVRASGRIPDSAGSSSRGAASDFGRNPETGPRTPESEGSMSAVRQRRRSGAFRVAMIAGAAAVAGLAVLGYLALSQWQAGVTREDFRKLAADNEALRAELARLTERQDAEAARLDHARQADLADIREGSAAVSRQIVELRNQLVTAQERLAAVDDRTALQAPDPAAASEATDGLVRRIDGLESKIVEFDELGLAAKIRARAQDEAVADLRAAVSRARQQTAEIEATLNSAREELEDRIRQASVPAAVTELRSALEAANARIDGLEELLKSAHEALDDPDRQGAVAIAVSRLRETMAGSGPFSVELAALGDLAAGDGEIARAVAPLAVHAADGVPSRALLSERFPGVVSDVVARAVRSKPANDWWDRTLIELRSVVRIRRVDGKGSEVDAVLARAETAIRRGDLAAALEALSALGGDPANAAGPWIEDARTRLVLEDAADALAHIVLRRLGAANG